MQNKFFFEKQIESSDEGELLDIAQNILDNEKVLRICEMGCKNELQIHVRRGFCFAEFLKDFRKPYNAKKKSYWSIVAFIGE